MSPEFWIMREALNYIAGLWRRNGQDWCSSFEEAQAVAKEALSHLEKK